MCVFKISYDDISVTDSPYRSLRITIKFNRPGWLRAPDLSSSIYNLYEDTFSKMSQSRYLSYRLSVSESENYDILKLLYLFKYPRGQMSQSRCLSYRVSVSEYDVSV